MSNTTSWKLKEKTAQTRNVVTWPDLRTSHGWLVWNFLSWDWVLAGIIPFWTTLFILLGLYGLPLQLHDKVLEFDSMKHKCGEGIKELFFKYFPYRRKLTCFHRTTICLCIQSLWQYLIKKTGKAWNKKYESSPFVFVYKAYDST